jgi:hypothetical protein
MFLDNYIRVRSLEVPSLGHTKYILLRTGDKVNLLQCNRLKNKDKQDWDYVT